MGINFWMSFLKPLHSYLLDHHLKMTWFACVILTTFSLIVERWWTTQSFASSKPRWLLLHPFHLLTHPLWTIFFFLVLPLRWFKSEVKGVFHYMLAFFKEVCPFCIASIMSYSCWFVHLLFLNALGILLSFVELCVVIVDDKVIGLLCWCCDKLKLSPFLCIVVASWDCHPFCVVGGDRLGLSFFLVLITLTQKSTMLFFLAH
jgi:hypothetical protein